MSLSFIEEVFAEVEVERKVLWPHEPQLRLRTAAKQKQLAPEQLKEFEYEVAPWEMFSSRNKPSCWGTFYSPTSVGEQTDGTRITVPDLSSLDSSAIACWRKRLEKVNHPVLRARYADVIWDISKVAASSEPQPVECARAAVDAYRDGVRAGLTHQPYFDLERALTLSFE
ncbi:DUF7380 domain-containing protein [Terriglobus sp.]|uniref:DUF7380 domain-containing protein n=1 Tax=Terriglobus sp. TaxID=1889013 RepID=UPI003B006A63